MQWTEKARLKKDSAHLSPPLIPMLCLQGAIMSGDTITEIVQKYNTQQLIISESYSDRGLEPLWGRFERAATNQLDNGTSTVSRYGIWANTVRDNIIEALHLLEHKNDKEAKIFLLKAANSMSASGRDYTLLNY